MRLAGSQAGFPLWLLSLLFVLGALAMYVPALNGEFIWDDVEVYIVKNQLLRDPWGLYKFWFTNEPLDYFPLTYTTFWLEWQLVEDHTLLYHLNNVLIHAATSVGVYLLMKQLNVPWAGWLAVVFLVHPIQVESVAWIAQRKTVLSVLFGVYAIWLYALSQEKSSQRMALWALVAYTLSLTAKPTLITLPVALALVELVIRRATWSATCFKLLPYFGLSLAFGIVGLIYVDKLLGLIDVREQNLIERFLTLSWAFLFYFRQLFAVWTLNFVYPRWDISAFSVLAWIPTIAVAFVTAMLWKFRNKIGPEPFLAWSIAWITMLPSLGLVDIGFWRYSYVGDHYVYQSLPAMLALGAYLLVERMAAVKKNERRLLAVGSVLLLALCSYLRCEVYQSPTAIWTDTLQKNPNAGMAWICLGSETNTPAMFLEAIKVQPGLFESWLNLANLYLMQGDTEAALQFFEQCELAAPRLSQVHLYSLIGKIVSQMSLGNIEAAKNLLLSIEQRSLQGDLVSPVPPDSELALKVLPCCIEIASSREEQADVEQRCMQTLQQLSANSREAAAKVAQICEDCGLADAALIAYQELLAFEPDNSHTMAAIGRCYLKLQRYDLALDWLGRATRVDGDSVETWMSIGIAHMRQGRLEDGLRAFEHASRLPESRLYFRLWSNLGLAFLVNGQPEAALEAWRVALDVNPNDHSTLRDVAWLVSTNETLGSREDLRKLAMQCAQQACELTDYKRSDCLDSLAATHANIGDYQVASSLSKQAIELAAKNNEPKEKIEALQARRSLFESKKPFRE